MGFWKRNWEKITSDTISGVLMRLIVPIILLGGAGYAGIRFIPEPILKGLGLGIFIIILIVLFLGFIIVGVEIETILAWLLDRREFKIRESDESDV